MDNELFNEVYESLLYIFEDYEMTVNDTIGLLETIKFDILDSSKPEQPTKPHLRTVQ